MRNFTFLDNLDASLSFTSEALNIDQRVEWKITIDSVNLDGIPRLFIEQGFTGGKAAPPSEWVTLCNPLNVDDYFPINDDLITIEKKDFKGNWFRVRFEPNDNTTGNTTVKLSYKTFP
jgi:hypothetical protein